MSYYMGDYYAGDYYQGDPFFGALIKGIGGLAKKAIGGVFKGGAKLPAPITTFPGRGISPAVISKGREIVKAAGRVIVKHPVLSGAAAAGAVGVAAGAGARALMEGAGCPKGFHTCKSRYGCKTGDCVRNRRMNVCNPRALRRGIRRAAGFSKLARRVMRFTSPRPPRGRAYFRPRRRKK